MAEVYNSASDFVLFPRDRSYLDTLDSGFGDGIGVIGPDYSIMNDMHRHRDFSGPAGTSYETYPPVSASSSGYFEAPNPLLEAAKGAAGQSLPRNPSSASPSPSVSHTFDQSSSRLSSASGASAQSTASSADNSPYANATQGLPYQEKWTEPLHGLGIGPEIVNEEDLQNHAFPPAGFENDLILGSSKFPSYVGEYHKNFSPSLSSSFPVVSPLHSTSASQFVLPVICHPHLALDIAGSFQDVTIDSILEGSDSERRISKDLISPSSAVFTIAPQTFHMEHCQKPIARTCSPSFRSPKTPASAKSHLPSPACTPHGSVDCTFQIQAPVSPSRKGLRDSPQQPHHRFDPYHRPSNVSQSQSQAPFAKYENLFFSQSSGGLIAPLESSCRFSLSSPFDFPQF